MKVILASAWYFPETTGGTEVYVDSLARALQPLGIEPVVVAPSDAKEVQRYRHRDVRVVRYPVAEPRNAAEARGDQAPSGHALFEQILREENALIYHQQAWSRGLGGHHLLSARALGLRTLLTVHTPALLCRRGTLLENGTQPCDGRMDAMRCARCFLQQRGLPPVLASRIAALPETLSRKARNSAAIGRLSSVLGARAESALQIEALAQAAGACEKVIAVCAWLLKSLSLNGIDPAKLLLCRQGLSLEQIPQPTAAPDGPLRIGYLGRFDPVKGIAELVHALKSLPPRREFHCEIRAPEPRDDEGKNYRARVLALIENDARFALNENRPRAELADFFASIHVLAVPSQWFETGPLVVLEAHAHGVPVLGTRLGGIAELVEEGVNGWLTDFGDARGLELALARLCAEPPARLLKSVQGSVRQQSTVAAEMRALYAG